MSSQRKRQKSPLLEPFDESPSKKSRNSVASSSSKKSPHTHKTKISSNAQSPHTPTTKEPSSTPFIQTPKTPRQAASLGIPSETAKSLLKYASELRPLVMLLYEVCRFGVQQKEVPSEEDFKDLLIELAKSVVSLFTIKNVTSDI